MDTEADIEVSAVPHPTPTPLDPHFIFMESLDKFDKFVIPFAKVCLSEYIK